MNIPPRLAGVVVAIAGVVAPAAAQDLAARLHVQGDVMVSSGGEFTRATDGQPVLAGQRILVGERGSATVEFSQDCKRTYQDPGVYTVEAGRCRDDDRSGEEQEQAAGQSDAASPASGMLGSAWVVVGTAVGIAAVLEGRGDAPVSR